MQDRVIRRNVEDAVLGKRLVNLVGPLFPGACAPKIVDPEKTAFQNLAKSLDRYVQNPASVNLRQLRNLAQDANQYLEGHGYSLAIRSGQKLGLEIRDTQWETMP